MRNAAQDERDRGVFRDYFEKITKLGVMNIRIRGSNVVNMLAWHLSARGWRDPQIFYCPESSTYRITASGRRTVNDVEAIADTRACVASGVGHGLEPLLFARDVAELLERLTDVWRA